VPTDAGSGPTTSRHDPGGPHQPKANPRLPTTESPSKAAVKVCAEYLNSLSGRSRPLEKAEILAE